MSIRNCSARIGVVLLTGVAAWGLMTVVGARAGDSNQPDASSVQPAVKWSEQVVGSMKLEHTPADKAFLPHLKRYLGNGEKTVRAFFGKEFPEKFTVRLFPERAVMTEYWRREWGIPDLETQCWMVASGTASTLSLLSPRIWKRDACEHDAADTVRTQLVITHEMVHTFHGQFNPRPEFDGLDSIGWFLEGLAVYASGQLDHEYLAGALEAIEVGAVPTNLEELWSGKYRYGVSGSIVGYIDHRFGRDSILALLAATSESVILGRLGIKEDDLLADWKDWVVREGSN